MRTWHNKAQEIIAALCLAAYRQANYTKDGRKLRRHNPYSVPDAARQLIDCLNRADEHSAKSLMAHDYDISKCRKATRI